MRCGLAFVVGAANGQMTSDLPPVTAAATTAAAATTKRIVFLGDSLTAGYGLPVEQSYPSLIAEKIRDEHLPYEVVNAGLSGDTSAGGLRRIDWLLQNKIDLLVIALGANDGLRGLSPKDAGNKSASNHRQDESEKSSGADRRGGNADAAESGS